MPRHRVSSLAPGDDPADIETALTPNQPPNQTPAEASGPLTRLDAWMAVNPWHPRATPFFVYIIGILVGGFFLSGPEPFGQPFLRPFIYTVQVGLVVFLLWRYRRLLPELNVKFHWLAVPTGIGLLFAWVYLGYATIGLSRAAQGVPVLGDVMAYLVDPALPISPAEAAQLRAQGDAGSVPIYDGRVSYGDAWFWTTMSLRLLGMSIVVPLFEELWVRSAVLRGTFSPSKTKTAILQIAQDLPVIGDSIAQTKAAKAAAKEPPMFTRQLVETRVGQVSFFAVIASTLVFMLAHQRRDYLGCIACGVVWCWLVWYTNRPKKGETWADQPAGGRIGLGPIVWSHGITNAALWAWTLWTNDWQFL